jgi:hypothetical protein
MHAKHDSSQLSDRQFAIIFAAFVLLALVLAGRDLTAPRPGIQGRATPQSASAVARK